MRTAGAPSTVDCPRARAHCRTTRVSRHSCRSLRIAKDALTIRRFPFLNTKRCRDSTAMDGNDERSPRRHPSAFPAGAAKWWGAERDDRSSIAGRARRKCRRNVLGGGTGTKTFRCALRRTSGSRRVGVRGTGCGTRTGSWVIRGIRSSFFVGRGTPPRDLAWGPTPTRRAGLRPVAANCDFALLPRSDRVIVADSDDCPTAYRRLRSTTESTPRATGTPDPGPAPGLESPPAGC